MPPDYAELHAVSNFSFLRGASHPEELVDTALALGYRALAITDECSLAGVVRAYGRMKEHAAAAAEAQATIDDARSASTVPTRLAADADVTQPVAPGSVRGAMHLAHFRLIIGSEFALGDGFRLIALVTDQLAYERLCTLISRARMQAEKGHYIINRAMIEAVDLSPCCLILVPPCMAVPEAGFESWFRWCRSLGPRAHAALELHLGSHDLRHREWLLAMAAAHGLPVVAAGDVHMHRRQRRALQDVLTCIRHGCTLETAGRRLFQNGERCLRDRATLASLYPLETLANSVAVAELCTFDLGTLDYRYPREVVPAGLDATAWLRQLTLDGMRWRWPDGASERIREQIEYELSLIAEMRYEPYFLTVRDIVRFARERGILCQGRGSAANSVVCYCLGITEVNPDKTRLLFERFISKERNEPPDIDVDFEHERREEVIQYIYAKYGRERAAIAATVICYRKKSAIRDIGKVFGLPNEQIDTLSKSLAWWDASGMVSERLAEMGFDPESPILKRFTWLLEQLIGFPRHLSQHVGGFVISDAPLTTLVPIENAAMADRSIIQWDKDDLEELGLLKVDILALGMLTAIARCLALLRSWRGIEWTMATLPQDDPATYDMICAADTIGVFQVESRAQMSMLPRLRPRNYYDLVIEVSIVRPGPIQGGMVNPYLKRRQGIEPVTYPNNDLKFVLERTLGVPVFQEQVMEIAMVAAGFSPGQADALRRSMAAWRRSGQISRFHDKVVGGMLEKGYEAEFAESIFRQIEGFGEYGFPESHAASFALLVYVSCWLKCHEPAAFLCAMLNSQPLGFYAPTDLVQDARRHGVTVRTVDVNMSEWDHGLEAAGIDHEIREPDIPPYAPRAEQPAVRLGFRLVSGLSADGAEAVLAARRERPFTSIEDLVCRSGIHRRDQQALAIAGAFENLSGNRHQAQWDLLGVEQLPPLLEKASAREPRASLPVPTRGEDTVADYMSLGLTLGDHPLRLLRRHLRKRRILDSKSWAEIPNGRRVCLAGIIRVRQRPGSARGVLFMTLEDEGGPMNVIVWQKVLERYRREVLGAKMVAVTGITQREQGVTHLVAKKLEDLSWMLGELDTRSRDFH
ncbi:MAG: error-prone DNA polymerase [Gammaproteobacteria bacterium]|nr:MAG: error-prone DNA polymerase [Gammaproteobacteria bacterium]